MAFACCESCGATTSNLSTLEYGSPAGSCPDCGGRTIWMATPFAVRLLDRRRPGAGAITERDARGFEEAN
jgi:DNA-directed RNA polymerase subunit RPC12/RpoP